MACTIVQSVLAKNRAAAKLTTTSAISDNATFEKMRRHTPNKSVPSVMSAATVIIFACANAGTNSDASEYRLTGIGRSIRNEVVP